MLHQDGVAAKEMQTAAQSGALKMDFSNINRGAIELAIPNAKSQAIKDAAHHIGRIFGSDLNRKNTLTTNESARYAAEWQGFEGNDADFAKLRNLVMPIINSCNTEAEMRAKFKGDIAEICTKFNYSNSIFGNAGKIRLDEIAAFENSRTVKNLPEAVAKGLDLAELTEGQISQMQIAEMIANND